MDITNEGATDYTKAASPLPILRWKASPAREWDGLGCAEGSCRVLKSTLDSSQPEGIFERR